MVCGGGFAGGVSGAGVGDADEYLDGAGGAGGGVLSWSVFTGAGGEEV